MNYIALFFFIIFITLLIYFRVYLYFFPKNRLAILMYHQIDFISDDDLVVTLENLEKQLYYLKKNKFNSLFFSELNNSEKESKKIIITFDDGYYNNYQYLPQLLEKYNLKATVFIATGFIENGYKNHKIMSYENLRSLNTNKYIEFGLHSHHHHNLSKISSEDLIKDITINIEKLEKENIFFNKVLAYPYGRFPKEKQQQDKFFKCLEILNIQYALRIGNKINYFPAKKKYLLNRIDIKGKDSFFKFKLKLILGKTKLF